MKKISKMTGKQLYLYIFIFWVYVAMPIFILANFVENKLLMILGYFIISILFILAVLSVIKSWNDKNP